MHDTQEYSSGDGKDTDDVASSSNISAIIDAECFFQGTKMLPREIAVVETKSDRVFHCTVDWRRSGVRFHETPCNYFIGKHLTGLDFYPSTKLDKQMAVHWKNLKHTLLTTLGRSTLQNSDGSVSSLVAYKGGHVERDLLRELQLPSVDLETLGCPKASGKEEACGLHRSPESAHCALQDVKFYRKWLKTTSL